MSTCLDQGISLKARSSVLKLGNILGKPAQLITPNCYCNSFIYVETQTQKSGMDCQRFWICWKSWGLQSSYLFYVNRYFTCYNLCLSIVLPFYPLNYQIWNSSHGQNMCSIFPYIIFLYEDIYFSYVLYLDIELQVFGRKYGLKRKF